jgi:molybdopterin-binding protein
LIGQQVHPRAGHETARAIHGVHLGRVGADEGIYLGACHDLAGNDVGTRHVQAHDLPGGPLVSLSQVTHHVAEAGGNRHDERWLALAAHPARAPHAQQRYYREAEAGLVPTWRPRVHGYQNSMIWVVFNDDSECLSLRATALVHEDSTMSATMLSVRDAADRLGVSYSALKQWIYKGTVRTVRTGGGHHRVPLAEVDRLLARQGTPDSARAQASKRAVPARGVLVALSGRNQLRGIVDEVRHDGLLAQVRLRIGDQRLTAVITRDALTELGLRRGDEAVAIIKSTEVMIGREQLPAPPKRPTR